MKFWGVKKVPTEFGHAMLNESECKQQNSYSEILIVFNDFHSIWNHGYKWNQIRNPAPIYTTWNVNIELTTRKL